MDIRTLQQMQITERQHQINLIKWATLNHIPLIHIPNEGNRGAIGGAIQKQLGLRGGFPDLMALKPHGGYMGCFIEVKRVIQYYKPHNFETDAWLRQERWLQQLKEDGYFASFAFGWEEGVKLLTTYFSFPKTEVVKLGYNEATAGKGNEHDNARYDGQITAIPNCS